MKKIILFAVATYLFISSFANPVVLKFEVFSGKYDRFDTPVRVPLQGVNFCCDSLSLSLLEVTSENRAHHAALDFQIIPGDHPVLCFVLKGLTKANTIRKFVLKYAEKPGGSDKTMHMSTNTKTALMSKGNKKVLEYQYAVHYPPDSVDPIFRRSAFVHPLYSPNGAVLTRINPWDHYHHVGIWNPYTKTTFRGHHTDFWNLVKGQGTVKFAGFDYFIEGDVFAEVSVKKEHVDFQTKGGDQTTINERLQIRSWNVQGIGNQEVFLIDYVSGLSCATDSSIVLEKYRYGGGIGFRATEMWGTDNSEVITSEGKDRANADATRARWCYVMGDVGNNKKAGVLFLCHPTNRDYPQPMRVWPVDVLDGVSNVYFQFCPIRNRSWKLQAGNLYGLKYRMVVFDDEMTPEKAQKYWLDFAYPPVIKMIK